VDGRYFAPANAHSLYVAQWYNKPNKSKNCRHPFPLMKLEQQLLVLGFWYFKLLNTYKRISDQIRIQTFGEFVFWDKILVLTVVTNTFLASERGKPLYCSKVAKISGFKVSVIVREAPLFIT